MKKLEVRLSLSPDNEQLVGHLAESEHRLFFEYDAAFLSNPFWLSPFKLPPEPGLHEHGDHSFGPLFGLFDDSLPDGWGLLLMDRYFQQQGVALEPVSPLDRLAYLGSRTMGALTYFPPSLSEDHDPEILELHAMSREARKVFAGSSEDVLPELLRAGGSPGGARPKVLIGVRDDEVISGEDELPVGFAHWIVKFAAHSDAPDDGAVESAYAHMAKAAGIRMPETRLFHTAEGDRFFGVSRFDRSNQQRFHVHTFGNLIHANFRIPGCDYEQLLKVTRILTKNEADVTAMFRRMIFNALAHNRDDHVKNFAFLFDPVDGWSISPAYDLTFTPGPGGEHTMTVAGEGKAPGSEHFKALAGTFDIPRSRLAEIVEQVAETVSHWPTFASEMDVSQSKINEIKAKIESCLGRL